MPGQITAQARPWAAIIRSGARVSSVSRTVTRGSCNPSVNLGPFPTSPRRPRSFGIPLGD